MPKTIVERILERVKALEGRVRNLENKTKRSEVTGGVVNIEFANLPAGLTVPGAIRFVTNVAQVIDGNTGVLYIFDGTNWRDYSSDVHSVRNILEAYTVAALPAPPELNGGMATMAFATDARKAGEGAGLGTGMLAIYDTNVGGWRDAAGQALTT